MNHHPIPKHYSSLAPTNLGTTPTLQQASQSAIAKVKGKFINLNLLNPKPSQMSSQDTHIRFYKSLFQPMKIKTSPHQATKFGH